MAGVVEEGPPDPTFRTKNVRPPFSSVAMVNVDQVHDSPGDMSLQISGDLVGRLRQAKFTADSVSKADPSHVVSMMRVLQLLFEAGESDIDWYYEKIKSLEETVAPLRLVEQDMQRMQSLNQDLEMRLKDRADRITELEAESAARKDVQREADGLKQNLYRLQGEFERYRITSEEYRKVTERKLEKAADYESRTRKNHRETERDSRAQEMVIQEFQDKLDQARAAVRALESGEATLQQQLRESELREKNLQRLVDESTAENDELKIRIEERDDQCLSLEKRAVEDLQTFKVRTEQVHGDKDRVIERLRKEAVQLGETVAMHKQEVHDMRHNLAELQQQTEDMAEKAASKEKESKQLRTLLERERSRAPVQDSQHLNFLRQSGAASPMGTYDAAAQRDDYLQLSDALKAAKRELLLEQAKLKDGETDRARLDRDVAELRKQLDVYESSGPGAAVRDMRQQLAEMNLKLDEREDAISELRDRLNRGDEELDAVLQVTESLKQLALSLGVSREELERLAHRADTAQRKLSEIEELEEKIRVRDKEIELLERERLHWKKQVRLQSLPRLEQAQRMGLTPDQLAALSDITDRMRESGLSDVQALVGLGPDDDGVLYSQTRHAELERKLQLAKEKNDALTEMHHRLRSLYMDVCKERDERRVLSNLAGLPPEEEYMQGLLVQAAMGGAFHGLDQSQQQQVVAQLLAASQQQQQPQEGAEGTDTTSSPKEPQQQQQGASGTEKAGQAKEGDGKQHLSASKLVAAAAQQTSPFGANLFGRLSGLPGTPGFGGGGDDRLARLASDYRDNANLLQELKKELQRTNDSLENAEKRSRVYMEERDAFRRTLALQQSAPPRPPPPAATAQPPPSTQTPDATLTQPQDGTTAPAPAAGAPTSEVWDTDTPALTAGAHVAEVAVELRRIADARAEEARQLLEQNGRKDREVQEARVELAALTSESEGFKRDLQMRGDELLQAQGTARMLRESLGDAELLLREERARLEEHQEFIASLGGDRDGEAIRHSVTETLRKVTTMRVNELRLIHRYKMCKAESDASRQRLTTLESQHDTMQRSLSEELTLARSQLKESEGIQRILHDRLEVIENTRTHASLREQLSAAQQQLQELLAVDRGVLEERSAVASLKQDLEFQKLQAAACGAELEACREKARLTAAAGQGSESPRGSSALQTRVIELDVEAKECRQKMEHSRQRAENAAREANALEGEKQEMKLELLSMRKEKVALLGRIQALEGEREDTMPLSDVRRLQQRADDLDREKAGLEAKLLRATDVAQASVETDLTVTQIQQNYRDEMDVLRRVIEGMDPASEEGYILGEMQYRTLQQTVENVCLKKEKDRLDLLLVSKRQQSQTLQVQNTQLMADLSRIYNEFITRSHELHQENSILKSDTAGRLSPAESQKVNKKLQEAQELLQLRDAEISSQALRLRQMGEIQRDSEEIRGTLRLLGEGDLSKVEVELKRKAGELSSLKLSTLQGEWEVDQMREEVRMLRRVKQAAEDKIKGLHERTVELQQQRDGANSEFASKIEEMHAELKKSKARESVIRNHTSSEATQHSHSPAAAGSGDTASPRRAAQSGDLGAAGAHSEELAKTIKELRQQEAQQARTVSELRAANAELRSAASEMESSLEKKERVAEALQKEILNERVKAQQAVERVRQAETTRGEAMSEVAKLNVKTMQDLLRKKDDALSRLSAQLQADRQKGAAEKQIDNARIAKLHQQLHQQGADQLKKFSDRLDSITLAPPLGPDGEAPVPGSLADIKLAQMTAEMARLQSKLSLADAEVRRMQREKQEAVDKLDSEVRRLSRGGGGGGDTAPADTSRLSGLDPDTSISSELARRLKDEIQHLGDELRKERDHAKAKEHEALGEKRLRLEQEEEGKRREAAAADALAKAAARAQTKEVEVSTEGLQDMIALHEQAEAAAASRSDRLAPGDRVMAKRQVVFRSGKVLDVGDCGVVSKVVSEGDAKGEDRILEVVFDREQAVYDARPGLDVELCPNPAFTVYHDTPIHTVNSIILQRETLIRKHSLQIDALERDLLAKTKEISRLAESEALALRKQKETEAALREVERFVASGSEQGQPAASSAKKAEGDAQRIASLEQELQQARKERRLAEAECRDMQDSVRNLKREVAHTDTKMSQLERRKVDEELSQRFSEVQESNAENVKSLQERLRQMEADLGTVLDRELALRKEAKLLETEVQTEKTAKELAQQAVQDAMQRRTLASAGTSPRRSNTADGYTQPSGVLDVARGTSAASAAAGVGVGVGVSFGPGDRDAELRFLRGRVAELEHAAEGLAVRNNLLRDAASPGGQSASHPSGALSRRVEDLLREKAEWTAIQEAMLRHLRSAQQDTAQKERAIQRQLDACRNATEVRVRTIQNEAELLERQKDAHIGTLEARIADMEGKATDDQQVARDLEETQATVATLKAELARSETSAKSLRQKATDLQKEEDARKERIRQARTDKAAAKRDALREVGVNTVDIDDADLPRRPSRTRPLSSRGTRAVSSSGMSTSPRAAAATTTTTTSSGSHTQELMKYWEENKKLKKQVAALKEKGKKGGAHVTAADHEKLKTEAAQLYEELQFTRQKLKEKGEELHRRAVDLHTFEKLKGFKAEVMALEEENDKLRHVVEVDKELQIRNLQRDLKRKDEALLEYERLAALSGTAAPLPPPTEVLPSEPHRVMNSIAADLQASGAPGTAAAEKVEGLRHMFRTLEDSLMEAKNQALQLRYEKQAAVAQQQRAERHLRDLMSISPKGFASVDEVHAANVADVLSGSRHNRDRQMHDLQQVVDGLRQVVQKLQSDNDTLRRNGVSNQKYVELLKEHKAAKQALEDERKKRAAAAEVAVAQQHQQAPDPAALTQVKKKLKKEQERAAQLQADLSSLQGELASIRGRQAEVRPEDAAFRAEAAEGLRAAAEKSRRDEDELAKLRTESRVLSEELERSRGACGALTQRCEKLEADLSLFDSDFLEEVAGLQRANEELKAENQRLGDRLRARGALAGADEPLVSNVASLRQRGASLRNSVDSLASFASSTDDDPGASVTNRIAAILRSAGANPNASTSSALSSHSTATLDLSSFPGGGRYGGGR